MRAEVTVDEPLVRSLLASLPDHSRTCATHRSGSSPRVDNAVWLVGTSRRSARRPGSAAVCGARPGPRRRRALVDTAARWSAEAFRPVRETGIRVPVPAHRGTVAARAAQDAGPPQQAWPWFLVEWVPGTTLDTVPVAERAPVAEALARALPRLHRAAPPDAPVNPARGTSLRERRPFAERHLPAAREVLGETVVDRLLTLIDAAEEVDPWPGAPVWCHGDLHDLNLALADDGTAGVLDLDDLTSGDPAVDLRVLWISFDEPTRAEAMATLEASGAYDLGIWVRARGWAASSFVLPIVADRDSRPRSAAAIEFCLSQLGVR